MYRQHFGLRHAPLGKETAELWDDGSLGLLRERFQWLLHSPGVGLLVGEPGVGKTAALRHLVQRRTRIATRSSTCPRPTSGVWTCIAVSPWP
jgi:hypothetical protein